MTARPPFDDDALSPEERVLAARLSALDTGGPSPALDARILAAARAAVDIPAGGAHAGDPPSARAASSPDAPKVASPPRSASPQRSRRWPTVVGAAATLVIAVGLAWQLKPLVDIPPPLRGRPQAAVAADAEVLAHAEPVAPATAAAPPSADVATADESAGTSTMRAPRPRPAAPPRAAPGAVKAAPVLPEREAAIAPLRPDEYVDEAVGDHADARVAVSAAAAPAVAAEATGGPPLQRVDSRADAAQAAEVDRVQVTGSRIASPAAPRAGAAERITVSGSRVFPPVAADASLTPIEWLERIRARRDTGQIDDARASLRRFVRAHPRHRLPDDLRALLAAPR